MNSKTKKIMGAALSITMAATIAASQIITYAKEPTSSAASLASVQELAFDELTGSIDLSDIVRDNLSDQVIDYGEEEEVRNITGQNATKTVIISLNTESIVEAKGDDMTVAEYLGTAAGERALKNIVNSQNKLLSDIAAAGIAYKEVARYSTVLNAVAIEVNTSQFSKIKKLHGVSMAGVSKTYAALSAVDAQENYSKIYGTGIYDSTDIMDKYGYDGSGVTVAILDTGLDYTHEAFSYDPEGEVAFEKSDIVRKIEAGNLVAAQRSPGLTADDVYLSAKVPFAYDYSDNDADVYPSYSQHGVHVAGIVAGKAKTYIDKDGNVVDDPEVEYDFMGVAPNAQLVICKVFTDDLESDDLGGARSEDIIAALDDCVTLGVDIINMSLGTTSGFSNLEIDGDAEGEQLRICYENIKKEGISLIAAAGNEYSSGYGSEFGTNLASNPDSGTVGSPSTFVGSMSVASVNGQKASYMLANPGENSNYGNSPIYYEESNDSNAIPFDFAEDMLGDKESATFTYFIVPGAGEGGDYSSVRSLISAIHANNPEEKVIVVVRRGKTSFKEKVSTAKENGADGIIVYNNVPGTIRMSLADIKEEEWIPSASVNMDAGTLLTVDPNNAGRLRSQGKIEINKTYAAGPFMNDYSSWGATPDLGLKPDITSHGGEITSAVSGGYEEMSGTSMATPNLAGLMALVRDYLKKENPNYTAAQLTTLTNQIVMSSATLLFDEEKLPYSPRKQGAGLATLENIFSTKAYLATDEANGGAEDNRPKIELGEDKNKAGVYNFSFSVTNFGTSALNFKLVSRFFTETLASNGLAVAEAAHMLDDIPAEFTVSGASKSGDVITVAAGKTAQISVALKLSTAEKSYIDKSFKNGMYIEGFISLESKTDGQCNLNLPFMGFYGDWYSAPMLDYNAYEIAEIQKDSSIIESEKPHESVFATQLYSTYYNGRYGVPMGGYAYVQDDSFGVEQIYITEEHCSISRFNIYNGATATDNYLTSTGIRALYAGLLRNAEVVTFDIYNIDTGEKVYTGEKYRIGKAYANGGGATPALVDLKLDPDTLGLVNNGKYSIEFNFYMKAVDKGTDVSYDNNFTSTFYVDYDAPIMQGSRIRYYNYKEGNDIKQRVYLDIDVYDNHYPQAVLLCYSNEEYQAGEEDLESIEINLATEYVTPIYNPVRNSTNTVSIEITNIYQKYRNRLYVQLDDYALNHSVYRIYFNEANTNNAESDVSFVLNDRVTASQGSTASNVTYNLTIEKNEMYRVELNCGTANASNYTWTTSNQNRISIRGNEIFGLSPGTARVTVTGGAKTLTLNVTVVDSNRTLSNPNLTFGVIKDENQALVKATGTVSVNAGQTFDLDVESDPWYYPVNTLNFTWTSSNEALATVNNGTVTTNNKRGVVLITATAILPNGSSRSASVTLNIQEPFNIANMSLNKYYGSEEVVKIPDDKNVMYIGEEAFKDNDTMKVVIIPKTVVEISERAFLNCTALEKVYFIKETKKGDEPVADLAKLNLVLADAFQGCTNLQLVDLTNVKVITLGASVFAGCESLSEVRYMEKIGISSDYAFKGCTALKEINITGLHTAGNNIFEGCTQLETIETGHYTAIGKGMFYGCTALEEITIKNPRIEGDRSFSYMVEDEDGNVTRMNYGGGAFENCTNLTTVNFQNDLKKNGNTWDTVFRIASYAFAGCTSLATVNFNGLPVSYIGDYAFKNTSLTDLTLYGTPTLGNNIFDGVAGTVNITFNSGNGYTKESNGAIYRGTTLVLAPTTIDSSFTIKADTTEIAPYAFSSSKFDVETITIPNTVEIIGEGAFYGANITSITIPANVSYIPAYAFAQSALESITIPSTVKEIGANAFENCRSLATLTINNGVELIGSYAFSGTAIQKATLPESVKTMGSYVFYNCSNLTEATLPAIEELGSYTFTKSLNLQKVTFGANAKTSGSYTFFPGSYYAMVGDSFVELYYDSALTTVDLGGLKVLGEAVFWACKNLETIDLKNITEVGMGAFTECSKLKTVTGIGNLTKIGDLAFAATALGKLELTSAKEIGEQAFFNVKATEIKIPVAETIGNQAFVGSLIYTLEIPSTLKTLGAGSFMKSENLSTVTVGDGNKIFFTRDNVLYRIIENAKTGAKDTYELCLYPAALRATENEGYTSHYRVIDGTVTIQAYAFAYINSGMLSTVTLPYSLKTIGAYAFYSKGSAETGESYSTITRYNFESIVAPTLLSEYYDLSTLERNNINLPVFRSMFYTNFKEEIIWYVSEARYNGVVGTLSSTTVIAYPSNGTGYTNYVYSLYFGTMISLGELIEDDIRTAITLIDSFVIDTVSSWLTLAVNNENKAMVVAFSEQVKEAHRLYNNYATKTVQLGFLNKGEDRVAKLLAVEEALKPVKSRFGISANISSAHVSDSSKHRTTYKAGESFDMTGLEIEVEYDDYSTEIITDTSLVTLVTTGPLYAFDNFVSVRYAGSTFRIAVTVTEDGGSTVPPTQSGSGCSGCGSMDIGSTLGGTGLVLLTLVGAILLMHKVRRKANK